MKTKSNMTVKDKEKKILCKLCKGTGKIYSSKMTTPSGLIDCPDCKTKSNPLSKLQSEAVKEFKFISTGLIKNISVGQYDDKGVNIGFKSGKDVIKQFLSDQIQKAYSEGREEVLDMANDELNQVINNKTIKYPPKYGVRLPNRPIPMEEQMFMCEEVAWRRVIEKLSIQSKEK